MESVKPFVELKQVQYVTDMLFFWKISRNLTRTCIIWLSYKLRIKPRHRFMSSYINDFNQQVRFRNMWNMLDLTGNAHKAVETLHDPLNFHSLWENSFALSSAQIIHDISLIET